MNAVKLLNASAVVKTVATVALAGAALVALAGCGAGGAGAAAASDDKTIVVGASPAPHAEILEQVKSRLADEGYTLEIKEYTDYVQPNLALEDGALDANYFQHITYLNDFNEEKGTNLASAGSIHFEPLCLYPGKTASLDARPDGAQIAVPSDTTNEARALQLLQAQGLITIKDGAGFAATANDIVDNPKNIKIIETEAASLPRTLQDVDLAVINGNYAIGAGLEPSTALASEGESSEAAEQYVNVVAVRAGDESSDKIKALVNALQSDEVKQFIEQTYGVAVIPSF